MISCKKCGGKVFVDLTFTDNKDYEVFCLLCGSRWFVGKDHPLYSLVNEYVKGKIVG